MSLFAHLLVAVAPEGFGRNRQSGRLALYRVVEPKSGRVLPAEEWTLIGKLEHSRLAGVNRVRTRGAFAYVGSSLTHNPNRADGLRGNVSVVDLTDPTQPKLRGSVDFPDMPGPNGLEVAGTVVFAAGGQTVQAIDVSNPDAPRALAHLTDAGAFPGGADDGHDLVYDNGHLFVTAQTSHSLVVLRLGQTLVKQIAACDCPDSLRPLASRARLSLPAHRVFVGESLTALFPASNYVAKVRACLQAPFGDVVRVTNAGVGGDTITRVQTRLDKDVLQLEPKPTHVFLFLGHNNSQLTSSSRYQEPEDFERQYREVVSRIQKTLGAKVIILSATSSVYDLTKATAAKAAAAGKAHNLFGKPEALEQFNAIARNVATSLGADYVNLYEPTRTHPDKPSLFTPDGVHINDAGNTLVVREVLRYLSR